MYESEVNQDILSESRWEFYRAIVFAKVLVYKIQPTKLEHPVIIYHH